VGVGYRGIRAIGARVHCQWQPMRSKSIRKIARLTEIPYQLDVAVVRMHPRRLQHLV
jgi:hypothetical protein